MAAGRGMAVCSAACAFCLPALLLTGCSSGMRGPDPLRGDQRPLPTVASRGEPAPGSVAGAPGPLPALPAPSSSTSPAALTTGAIPQLSPGRDLRATPTSNQSGASAVTLSTPRPLKDTPAGASLQPIALAGGPGGSPQSLDQAMKILQERGVQGFRLERQRDTSEWRCICSIPNRKTPTSKQVYDTRAADPLSALRAIVAQAEQDPR